MTLYCSPDPNSIRRAEEAMEREIEAQSSIVSITRTSKEELEREAFWARVERREQAKVRLSRLRLVRR